MQDQFSPRFAEPTSLLNTLTQFVRGELTDVEHAMVKGYLAEHENDAALVNALVLVRSEYAGELSAKEIESSLDVLMTQVRSIPGGRIDAERLPQRASLPANKVLWANHSLRRLGWGAAIMLMFIIGEAAFRTAFGPQRQELVQRTYTTRPGQRATVGLPDGTSIILAPQTTLVVNTGFGTSHRDVRVTGQAYFDVVPTSKYPFIVRTGEVTSRVLGTQFSVRHYANDRDVVIAVRLGRVSTGRDVPVVVSANSVARITDSTATVTTVADLQEYIEWIDGRLVFQDASVSDVATVLGRWYGLTFQFTDSSLLRQNLTGVFENRESRQEVLQSLQLMLDVRMTFNDSNNVVTLISNRPVRLRRDLLPGVRSSNQTKVGR